MCKKLNLETERLTIRFFEESDYNDLYEYLSDEETIRFEPYEVFSLEQCIQEAKQRAENHEFYAVCQRDTGKVIGNLYLGKRDFEAYELGYVFNRKYWKHGYASEAAGELIRYTFENLGARRIISECNPQNEDSWKLLERLGMRCEGKLIQNIFFKRDAEGNPIWLDTFLYGILKEESMI